MTDAAITSRRTAYRCCLADAAYERYKANQVGKDEEAAAAYDRMVTLALAIEVLDEYLVGDETCNGQRESTLAEVCCMIKHADKCCVSCTNCDDEITQSCEKTAAYTALSAVLEADLPSPATEGDIHLVTDTVEIATWTAGAYVMTPLQVGQIVDVAGTLYINQLGTIGPLFPGVSFTLVGPSTYDVVSLAPAIAANSTRTVRIYATIGGSQVLVFQGLESLLASTISFNAGGLDATALSVEYVQGSCSWDGGAVTVVPPLQTCGTVTVLATRSLFCGTNEFDIDIDIQAAPGFPLGQIIPYVNGVAQTPIAASIGNHTIGTYQDGDTVTFVITNTDDASCNYTSASFVGPEDPDFVVIDVLDGFTVIDQEAPGYVAGIYYIVSDVLNIFPTGGYPGYDVGVVVDTTDTSVVGTPQTGDIILATATGIFYEVISPGVIAPLYPEPILTESGGTWTLSVAIPATLETGNTATAYANVGGVWEQIWTGDEALLDPGVVVTPSGTPQQVRILYDRGTGCTQTVYGTVIPVFTCAGDGYFSLEVTQVTGAQGVSFNTLGHMTMQKPDDSTVTMASPGTLLLDQVGPYCFWISDVNGSPSGVTFLKALTITGGEDGNSGHITNIDLDGIIVEDLALVDNDTAVMPDISHMTALDSLTLIRNQIATAPNVSSNVNLEYLYIDDEAFTTGLDLSSNTDIEYLQIQNFNFNQTLDLTSNDQLGILIMSATAINFPPDLSNCALLTVLQLDNNANLSEAPEVFFNPALVSISLVNNDLTAAPNTTFNPALTSYFISWNSITLLDINTNTALLNIDASNNAITNTDQIFNVVESFGTDGGFIDLSGGTNADVTPAGSLVSRTELISRSWNITFNGTP
jgi:hypothetical protein